MDSNYEKMRAEIMKLGERAVVSGEMKYGEAAAGALLASASLLVLGGLKTELALAAMKKMIADLENANGRKKPNQRPEGYANITARDFAGGDGPLTGHRIVFTGSMEMARQDAAALASGLGAQCSDSVSAKTTILVVGNGDGGQSHASLGHGIGITITAPMSGKQAKAQKLIAEGAAIRIMDESEFLAMCNSAENKVE